MLTKKDIKQLRSIGGKIRGESIKVNFDCYLAMEGKQGLEKLKKRMQELNFFVDYQQIGSSGWYPLGDDVALTALAAEVFNWDERKLKEFGRNIYKVSLIEKMFIQYLASSDKLFQKSAEQWKRHISIGKLEVMEYNKKEKYVLLRLKDFKAHPSYCAVLMGFFESIIKMIFSGKKIDSCEIKCLHKGDSYHEYLFKWQ